MADTDQPEDPGRRASPGREAGPSPVRGNLASMMRLLGIYRRQFATLLAAEPWVVESGVKPPAYGVLSVIEHRGPVSQREVCDLVGIHPSDLVPIMDDLERQGWVARRRDPADRRRYQLTLTPEGRRTLARYDAIAARTEAIVLDPLDEEERRRLNELVAKVAERQARAAERP